jgi:HEAT repeat protein
MTHIIRLFLAAALGAGLVAAPGAMAPALAQESDLTPAARDALVKLQSAKPNVRREGIEKLGELKSRGAAGDVARVAAEDPDPSVRRTAAIALGSIGDRSQIPAMIATLEDPDPKVRGGGVEGLLTLYVDISGDDDFFSRVRSGFAKMVPFYDERATITVEPYDTVDSAVTAALAGTARRDSEKSNRAAAVRALGALRARDQIDALADAMAADADLRHEVLDAFVLIGDPEAATYAIPFFTSPDASLAAHAMLATGRLRSEKAVIPLLDVYGSDKKDGLIDKVKAPFSPERQKAALQALALIGDPRAEAAFFANLNDRDEERRRAGFEGLAREGDARFLPRIQRDALIERNDEVRLAQSFTLYKMGQPGVFTLIVNALRGGGHKDQAAEYVLEASAPADLIPFIRIPEKRAQLVVVEALGRVGDAQTADDLRPLVRGSSPEVALAADRAIRRIEWRMANATP